MPWRRSACRWRTGTCSNTYGQHILKSLQMLSHRNLQEVSQRCLLQTIGCLFLWSITSDLPNNEILGHTCLPASTIQHNILKQNLRYRYIMLFIFALVSSHTKFNMWFQGASERRALCPMQTVSFHLSITSLQLEEHSLEQPCSSPLGEVYQYN